MMREPRRPPPDPPPRCAAPLGALGRRARSSWRRRAMKTPPPAVDPDEIGAYFETFFSNADEGGFVSLRTFEHEPGKPPVEIRGVQINGEGLGPVIAQATG